MAPPTLTPRLQHLVPEDVAEEVVLRIVDRADGMLEDVRDPDCPPEEHRSSTTRSPMAVVVASLVAWAQDGRSAPEQARDHVSRVCEAIYRPVYVRGEWSVAPTPPSIAKDGIAVVLRAASARYRLWRGEPVVTSELAALGGISHRRANQMAGGAGVLGRPGAQVAHFDGYELLAALLAPADYDLRKAAAHDLSDGLARWVCANGKQSIRFRHGGRLAALALERTWEPGFENETQEMEIPR